MSALRRLAVLAAAGLSLALAPAQTLAAPAHAEPDGPQLSAPGPYAVGVTRLDLVDPAQPDFTVPGDAAGAPARRDRTLPLTIWYPSEPGPAAARARYAPEVPGPAAGAAGPGVRTGAAFADAPPAKGAAAPLVIFSHGYSGWATGFSDLAEGLASRGYVVAAIDHRDPDPATAGQGVSFATVVAHRTADQRFVIAELTRRARTGPLAGVYDPGRIALIGYSMGGFGALATAGAGYDAKTPLVTMTKGALASYVEGAPGAAPPAGVKALVTIAPWGGAPPLRAWTATALAAVRTPTLVIVGDHDDVSGYADGVRWIYDGLTHADRRLLVYKEARHNLAGDGAVVSPKPDFAAFEHFEEPVWRRERILAINRHMITAFLDGVLKGDAAHLALLDAPTPDAGDGAWPLAPGRAAGDRFAAPGEAETRGYWPGFQRRWALGLTLRHDPPATP